MVRYHGHTVIVYSSYSIFCRFDNMPIRHFSYHSISGSLNMVTKQKFPTILFFQFFDDMMTLCHYFLLFYQFGNIVSISLVLIVLFFQWFGKGVTTSMSLFPVFLLFQWFGNMVTMEWWDDLWLNEGFASLLMYFAMDAIYPEWNVVCCKDHCLSVKKWLSSRTVVSSIFINIEYQFLLFSLLFIHKIKCSSKWNFTYVLY